MRALTIFLIFLLFSGIRLFGQDATWEKLRASQPEGLQLNVSLPKTRFFQGEEIDATLTLSNHSDQPCLFWQGVSYPGFIFRGEDSQGKPVADPLAWEKQEPHGFDGPIWSTKLGTYTKNQIVNDTLRFDAPGTYVVYAEIADFNSPRENAHSSVVVSDPVTITITPLMPKEEQQVLAKAKEWMAGPDITKGISLLSCLQTPAACDALLDLPESPDGRGRVQHGLLGVRDPQAEADRILKEVRSNQRVLNDKTLFMYQLLRHAARVKQAPTGAQDMAARQAEDVLMRADGDDLLKEALAASNGKGPTYAAAVWIEFERSHGGRKAGTAGLRKDLAGHQLDLPTEQAHYLVVHWRDWGGPEFLPLVQKMASPPENDHRAQALLKQLESHAPATPAPTPPPAAAGR